MNTEEFYKNTTHYQKKFNMGYSITKWKTEELTDMVIPISALYENETWSPDQPIITDIKNMETKLRFSGGSEITGHLSAGHLFVEMPRIEDDGSEASTW